MATAVGFLVCVVMVPVSYFVARGVVWVFGLGALLFLVIGALVGGSEAPEWLAE